MESLKWAGAGKRQAFLRVPVRAARFVRRPGLRRRELALARAIDQLHEGVPLNWIQIEDDPELIVLASLQRAASERKSHSAVVSPEYRQELFNRLAKKLPAERLAPVREAARPLAGFSESVPVLTQAEEQVPALTFQPASLVRALAAIAVVGLLVGWAAGALSSTLSRASTFSWIDVKKEGRSLFGGGHPGTRLIACPNFTAAGETVTRGFTRVSGRAQTQAVVSFPIIFLPERLTVPSTYTIRLLDTAVSPCADTVPSRADEEAVLKLSYSARHLLPGGGVDISPLTVFQSQKQRSVIDVTTGTWKEIHVGDFKGVYWRGGPYSDQEGTEWIGDVSVMLVERGDIVMTLIGEPQQGITEEMLTSVLDTLEKSRQASSGLAKPFNWIEVRNSEKVLSAAAAPSTARAKGCSARAADIQASMKFAPVKSLEELQQSVAYPVRVIKEKGRSYTDFRILSAEYGLQQCGQGAPQTRDPGAAAKLRYAISQYAQGNMVQVFVTMYERYKTQFVLDVSYGPWKEVQVGGSRGVIWSGSPYHDPEGVDWTTDITVLAFEKDDQVITLMGRSPTVAADEMLLQLAGDLGAP